jgi:DNA processing protein
METTLDLLTLALVPGLTPRAARELLRRGPVAATLARPAPHLDLLGERGTAALASGAARAAAEAELAAAERLGITIVGQDDYRYPRWLRQTHTPPLVLWTRGVLAPDEGAASVAVVGSRAASPLGLAFARRLADELAQAGVVVVSGLARGIDSAAHRGALSAGGRTVAVLGSGLDRIYPPENAGLAAEIGASGALVSEFPLGTRPWKSHFPRRNRVIAGWARAVVVVEAGARSGALSTARAALDEGREVMAVPGHPALPLADGTNALLRDGAALVRGADDVLAELGLARPRCEPEQEPPDPLLRALSPDAPRAVDEIQQRSGLALPALLARLSELELDGAALRLPGALFVRARPAAGYTGPR